MRPTAHTAAIHDRLAVLVLSTMPEKAEAVRAHLERSSHVALTSEIADLARGPDLLDETMPDLVVVVLDHAPSAALTVIEALHIGAPAMTILALVADGTSATALDALQAGAGECLSFPPPPAALAHVLDKVRTLKRLVNAEGKRRGALWTVVGPKEGVGATTLVVNLAVELCATFGRSVVLVDLDLERAELALFLNLNPPASLPEVAHDAQRLDPMFVEAALARHPAGPYLLAAPLDRRAVPPALAPAALLAVLDLLRARHDVVIIDAPPPLGEAVRAAIRASDRVLLPTELTVPCLRAAWRTIERLAPLGASSVTLEVIATKYGAGPTALSLAEARRTLKVPFTHVLPRDDAADNAANRGLPLADVDPTGPLRNAIAGLASELDTHATEESRSGLQRHSL